MSHDTYYPCPCGSGRKVKYCCGKEVAGELDKIMRALGGDQHAAALNLVRVARNHHPDNPALLVLQCELELDQEESGELNKTLEHLRRVAPQNPVGLALMAISAAQADRAEEAVSYVQDALEAVDEVMPEVLYESLGPMAQVLMLNTKFAAALAHLLLQLGVSPEQDNRPLEALRRYSLIDQIPISLKYQRALRPPAEDSPWKDQGITMLSLAARGRWRQACELLEQIDLQSPNHPIVLYNLANLQMRLGWNDEAAVNWGRLAALATTPLDDAVEAEALAQLLDPDDRGPHVDQVITVFSVTSSDVALERLLSERRLNAMPDEVRRSAVTSEDQPPPKAGFWVLDRPLPVDSADLGWRDIPHVVGELLLFGRQTDRNARLEFGGTRDEPFEDAKRWLSQVLGDAAQFESEQVLGSVAASDRLLMWRWRFPDGMPDDKRMQVLNEKRQHVLHEEWPHLKMAELDGQSPSEAASDPAQRICLLALLLNLELLCEQMGWEFDANGLRQSLGLPIREPIESPIGDAGYFPLERVGYLRPETLADDDLLTLFYRARGVVGWAASRRLMDELERRKASLADRVDYAQAYAGMAAISLDRKDAVTYLSKAADAAVAQGESPAQFLLASLPNLAYLGDVAQLQATLVTLQRNHLSEPGVAQALQKFLTMLQAAPRRGGPPSASAGSGDAASAGQDAGEAPGRLWTPDGASAAAPAESSRSKIWVPGMD